MPARPATEPDVVIDWLPHEAWFAARALVPGSHRVYASVAALREAPDGDAERERVDVAVRVSEDERALLRLDLAEMPARVLFDRAPTAANATRLARLLVLRGTGDEAIQTLTRAIDGESDLAMRRRLVLTRARAASASGHERAALVDFGAAFVDGDDEAGLELARRAQRDGHRARALQLVDWALAGAAPRDESLTLWGTVLVTPPEPVPAEAGSTPTKTVR